MWRASDETTKRDNGGHIQGLIDVHVEILTHLVVLFFLGNTPSSVTLINYVENGVAIYCTRIAVETLS